MHTDPHARSILVVEDDSLLRELVAVALESRGFRVVTAASAADARRAHHQVDPDGLVLDVDLGPGPSGFDLADALRRQTPHLPIVFLTNLPDPRFADRDPEGLPTGVAYLRKSALSDIDALVDALDQALRGDVSAEHRHDRDANRPMAALTRKQIDVLRLIVEGRTNAQIAADRGISLKAVEEVVGRTFAALGLDANVDGNLRVTAVRRYLAATEGTPPIGHTTPR